MLWPYLVCGCLHCQWAIASKVAWFFSYAHDGPASILHLFLQVKALIESATQAPFGRGEATIVDTSVRNTWQLDPSQFTINSEKWDDVLDDLGCRRSGV